MTPPGPGAAGATVAGPGQRSRILDAALVLVSELGAAGTSMRRLAAACGLNVATIYHYFPSKADLLRALVEEGDIPQLDVRVDRQEAWGGGLGAGGSPAHPRRRPHQSP